MGNKARQLFSLNETELNRNVGLDVLRSSAVFMLLFSHGYYFLKKDYAFLSPVNVICVNALEIFFVLSGFLVGNIILKQIKETNQLQLKNIWRFYKNRWFKTLPGYYLILVVYYFLSFSILPNCQDYNWAFLIFSQNFWNGSYYFFSQSYSLSIEEWFYVLFPVILFILLKLPLKNIPRMKMLLCIGAFLILPICYRLYLHIHGFEHWDSNIRKSIPARMDGIGYGLVVAYIFQFHRNIFQRYKILKLLMAVMLHIITQWVFVKQYSQYFNDVLYFSAMGLCFTWVVPFFFQLQLKGIIARFFIYISMSSYSVYLVHLLIRELFWEYVYLPLTQHGWLIFISYWCISMLIGICLWALFERPIMLLRNYKTKGGLA